MGAPAQPCSRPRPAVRLLHDNQLAPSSLSLSHSARALLGFRRSQLLLPPSPRLVLRSHPHSRFAASCPSSFSCPNPPTGDGTRHPPSASHRIRFSIAVPDRPRRRRCIAQQIQPLRRLRSQIRPLRYVLHSPSPFLFVGDDSFGRVNGSFHP
jgi:hypothetical protein